jgi:hypothetical protein
VEDLTSAATASQIPPEVKKIAIDFSTGETVLHKAARLGYVVKFSFICHVVFIDTC